MTDKETIKASKFLSLILRHDSRGRDASRAARVSLLDEWRLAGELRAAGVHRFFAG